MTTNGQISTKVITGKVRFSFCHLFTPTTFAEGQTPKYSIALLIDKNDEKTIGVIEQAYENAKQAGIQKYGQRFTSLANDLFAKPGDKLGIIKDGDSDPRYNENDCNHGKYILNAKCSQAPGVFAKECGSMQLTQAQEEILYSGCYGKASINFYPFQQAGNTGIGVGLNNVLKIMDGDNLGGRVSGTVDFKEDLNDAEDDLLG